MSNMECAQKLRSTPPKKLSDMLLQEVQNPKYLTIGDVLPEGDQEIEAILDKAVSNGRLIWDRAS